MLCFLETGCEDRAQRSERALAMEEQADVVFEFGRLDCIRMQVARRHGGGEQTISVDNIGDVMRGKKIPLNLAVVLFSKTAVCNEGIMENISDVLSKAGLTKVAFVRGTSWGRIIIREP